MAIIFTNNSTINDHTNGRVYMPQTVVQVVYNTWTGTTSSTGSGFINTFTTSINIKSGSRVLVEYYQKQRHRSSHTSFLTNVFLVVSYTWTTISTSGVRKQRRQQRKGKC
jgi:hypothetical protein